MLQILISCFLSDQQNVGIKPEMLDDHSIINITAIVFGHVNLIACAFVVCIKSSFISEIMNENLILIIILILNRFIQHL